MNIICKYRIHFFLIMLFSVALSGCSEADKEFVHTTNTISQMICKSSHGGGEFRGEIYEYNKNEELVTGSFKQEDIEGGYGLILFAVPKSLEDDVDLKNIYLIATVTFDEFITPSLVGRHDITGDGIIISVKSGVGTVRRYRVRGYYE